MDVKKIAIMALAGYVGYRLLTIVQKKMATAAPSTITVAPQLKPVNVKPPLLPTATSQSFVDYMGSGQWVNDALFPKSASMLGLRQHPSNPFIAGSEESNEWEAQWNR